MTRIIRVMGNSDEQDFIDDVYQPALVQGLLNLTSNKSTADDLVEYCISTKYPEIGLEYLMNQTFRSNLFMTNVLVPHGSAPKTQHTFNFMSSPLHLVEHIKHVTDPIWLEKMGTTSFAPRDPVVRLLGYRGDKYGNRPEGFDWNEIDSYFIKKILDTPQKTVDEITNLISPWSSAWQKLEQSIINHGYEIKFEHDKNNFSTATVTRSFSRLPKYSE